MNIPILFLCLYFAILVGIGVWATRRGAGASLEGYVLGGRSVGPLVTGLTLQSTAMSGYQFLGAGALAHTQGYFSLWYMLGDMGGGVLNMSVLGRRMRKLSQILGAVTSIEYLEKRYPSPWVRAVAAPLALLLLSFYVLAQFIAGGQGLALVTGLSYPVALFIAVGIIALYTFMGGYLAVAYTDFVQALIMLIGVLWILIAALRHVGGLGAANAEIGRDDPSLLTVWGQGLVNEGDWGVIVSALLIFSVGVLGWPHVVVRHMAMQRPSQARRAAGYVMAWALLFVSTPTLIGVVSIAIVPDGTDPELAIFVTAQQLLPAFALGIVMAGIMAAIMSTADSLLLQAGTITARDIYQRFINPQMNDRQMVWISRLIVLLIAVGGFIVAAFRPPAVFDLVVFSTAILGSAFAPAYVAAVWWPKANAVGALASILTGAGVTTGWELTDMAGGTGIGSTLAGLGCSTLAIYVGSILTQKSNPVPAYITETLTATREQAPIPQSLLKSEDNQLAGEAAHAGQWLRDQHPGDQNPGDQHAAPTDQDEPER